MSPRYVCSNPNHPVNKHPKYYDQMTQDGLCPDCEFGDGILMEDESSGGTPTATRDIGGGADIGLCILMCDASGSMSEEAFPGNPASRLSLVAQAAAAGISDLFEISRPETAYIALAAFATTPAFVQDSNGQPFVRSVAQIKQEFPTRRELATFLTDRLSIGRTVDGNYTDISAALRFARNIYEGALQGNFQTAGISGNFTLLKQSISRKSSGAQIAVDNLRVLVYSDGEHNPPDGGKLENPFAQDDPSLLLSVFIGKETEQGANQMKSLACTCPIHELPGYFLINAPERYQTLRRLFRMASGASGFCPSCLSASQESR